MRTPTDYTTPSAPIPDHSLCILPADWAWSQCHWEFPQRSRCHPNRPQDKCSDACGLPSTRPGSHMALGTVWASHRIHTLLHHVHPVRRSSSFDEVRCMARSEIQRANSACCSRCSCPCGSIGSIVHDRNRPGQFDHRWRSLSGRISDHGTNPGRRHTARHQQPGNHSMQDANSCILS